MIRLKYLEPQGYYKLINDKPVDTDTIPLVRFEDNKNEPNIYPNAPSSVIAKWLKLFRCNEEHSEPIKKDTVVMVLKHKISNEYYWIFICTDLTESSMKKRGKRIFKFYNEDNANDYNENNAIEFIIDTITKNISLTTPKNDGEKVKYEVKMDLKEKGTFSIKDDLNNSITLNSLLGELKILLKNTFELITKNILITTARLELKVSEKMDSTIKNLNESIVKKITVIDDRLLTITTNKETITNSDITIDTRNQKITDNVEVIVDNKETITNSNIVIDTRNQEITDNTETITNSSVFIETYNQKITNYTKSVVNGDVTIDTRNQKITNNTEIIDDNNVTINTSKTVISDRKDKIDNDEKEIDIVKIIKKDDGEEFYTTLVDLMQVLIDSKYRCGSDTCSADNDTSSKYKDIKKRLKKFTE